VKKAPSRNKSNRSTRITSKPIERERRESSKITDLNLPTSPKQKQNETPKAKKTRRPNKEDFVTYSYPIYVIMWVKTLKLHLPAKKGDIIYFQWRADDQIGNSSFAKVKENLKVNWPKGEKVTFFTDIIGDLASGPETFLDKEITFTFKRRTKDDNFGVSDDDMMMGKISLNILNYISTNKDDIYLDSPNIVMALDGDAAVKKKRMTKFSMKTKRGFTGQVFKAEDESLDVVGENSSEEPEKDEIFQIQLELEEQKRLYRELVTKQEKERQQYQKNQKNRS